MARECPNCGFIIRRRFNSKAAEALGKYLKRPVNRPIILAIFRKNDGPMLFREVALEMPDMARWALQAVLDNIVKTGHLTRYKVPITTMIKNHRVAGGMVSQTRPMWLYSLAEVQPA